MAYYTYSSIGRKSVCIIWSLGGNKFCEVVLYYNNSIIIYYKGMAGKANFKLTQHNTVGYYTSQVLLQYYTTAQFGMVIATR